MRTGWYSKSVTERATAVGGEAGLVAVSVEDAGWTGAPLSFPRIQGADACGDIVAVGPTVDPARIGERVIVEPVFRQAAGRLCHCARSAGEGRRGGASRCNLRPAP
jgi:NADPH:quinone reductase-like Zn-dependent oxidoreductase